MDGEFRTISPPAPVAHPPAEPHLRRVLSLGDLLLYAIVIVQPIAPLPVFGIAQADSRGHAVLTILVGMVAMMFTAASYGRMAARYPSAGSAYTYVARGVHPHAGFLAGWAMLLCYLMFPLINVIYIAVTIHRVFLHVPYLLAAAGCAAVITLLNLRGIRWTTRANQILFFAMSMVIVAFIALAVWYLVHAQGLPGLVSSRPFYNPRSFDFHSIRAATAFAILTYLGFDAVTTLAEDAQDPRRTVPRATVLVVFFTGALGGVLVYLGQLVWPDYHGFANLETAFMDVCGRVGGVGFYDTMGVTLVVACFGTALAAQVGAARLLFGMGRDHVLPKCVFARLSRKRNTPAWNIAIIGALAFAGSLIFDFEHGTDLLNFGAFLAFIGVNFAAFWEFGVKGVSGRRRNWLADFVAPWLGLLFCLGIWWGLPPTILKIGGVWFAAGLAYSVLRTRGFRLRSPVIAFDVGDDER